MSSIRLDTISYYQNNPIKDSSFDKARIAGIEALFPGTRFPTTGPTFFYGHNPDVYAAILERPENKLRRAHIISLECDVGHVHRRASDLGDSHTSGLRYTRFLNLSRAGADVLDYMKRVHPFQDRDASSAKRRDTIDQPCVIDELVKDERFSHLAAIAYTIHAKSVGILHVATVIDRSVIKGSPMMDAE